jgi:hypothetical protein
MNEKKHVYEAEVMALPPLRMVLGEVPSPDPERRGKGNTNPLKPSQDLVVPVKRLIAHLKEEK